MNPDNPKEVFFYNKNKSIFKKIPLNDKLRYCFCKSFGEPIFIEGALRDEGKLLIGGVVSGFDRNKKAVRYWVEETRFLETDLLCETQHQMHHINCRNFLYF
jgi:hypothetical protein